MCLFVCTQTVGEKTSTEFEREGGFLEMAYKGERKRRNDCLLNVSRSNLCLSLLLNVFVFAILSKYCKLETEKDTQIRIQKNIEVKI